MTSTELVGRDLDRAIAEAMGWTVNDNLVVLRHQLADGTFAIVPNFTTSLDALHDGPERVLLEVGYTREVVTESTGDTAARWWDKQPNGWNEISVGSGATEAEARARAALSALLAIKEARGAV